MILEWSAWSRARVEAATHDCSAILRTKPHQHYAHLRLTPWRGPAQWDATRQLRWPSPSLSLLLGTDIAVPLPRGDSGARQWDRFGSSRDDESRCVLRYHCTSPFVVVDNRMRFFCGAIDCPLLERWPPFICLRLQAFATHPYLRFCPEKNVYSKFAYFLHTFFSTLPLCISCTNYRCFSP